ncbi:MAG: hypothetical protein JSW11_08830 [Candidatus Heimdallarchaeota archaeon]|nr:MAG: hypothetical protein JSW11_08830 [Candidatus Heimdallarchaeota archaeon]
MKSYITIRKLNKVGDTGVTVPVKRAYTILRVEQKQGNFIYIPESEKGVYTPKDTLPFLYSKPIEILVFPPVRGG